MTNKKIIRNIIVAVLVIGILVAALIFAQKMPDSTTAPQDGNTNEEVQYDSNIEENVPVLSFEKEEVLKITIKNIETYTIVRDDDNTYRIENDGGILYSSDLLAESFNSFLTINAQKDVTEENVGFTEKARATIHLKDGTKKDVILGDKVLGHNNQRFLKYEDRTYAVLSYVGTYFTALADSFRTKNLTTIMPSVKEITIKKDGRDYVSLKRSETDEEINVLDVPTNFVLSYPELMAANDDRLTPFFELLGDSGYPIEIISFVDNNVNNKAKYGIGKKTVIIKDENQEHVFEFGDKDENGYVYTIFNGGNYIFSLDPTLYNIIDSYSPDYLMNRAAHLILITKINQVVIEGKDEKYVLDIGGSEGNYTYKINSKSVEESKFKEAYREIIGINVDSRLEKPVSDMEGEYTVTFRYLDGKKAVYKYVSYDDRNYVLINNGKGNKILLKKRLPEAMKNILKIIEK